MGAAAFATASRPRLAVGASGASGMPLVAALLEELHRAGVESHLVMSRAAALTCAEECEEGSAQLKERADVAYDIDDIGAAIASGTFPTLGMVVVPCSMKTVAGIASGYSDNLLLRAADVTLKEGRPLVLAARESPLSPIHLRNLHELSKLPRVRIVPPVVTYYNKPETIRDMERHIVGKLLEPFSIETEGFKRWKCE